MGGSKVSERRESAVGELKPCPFCGSTDAEVVSSTLIAGRHDVFCNSCKAHGPVVKSKRYAVPAWNKRADGVRVVTDCDEVASENDQLVRADARCESLDTDGPRFVGIAPMVRVTLAGDDVSVDATLAAELARKVSIGDAFEVVVIRKGEANG